MLEEMTLAEWMGWRREYQRRPWGERRDDLRNAVLIMAIAKLAGGKVEIPHLMWPYFETENELLAQANLFFEIQQQERERGRQ